MRLVCGCFRIFQIPINFSPSSMLIVYVVTVLTVHILKNKIQIQLKHSNQLLKQTSSSWRKRNEMIMMQLSSCKYLRLICEKSRNFKKKLVGDIHVCSKNRILWYYFFLQFTVMNGIKGQSECEIMILWLGWIYHKTSLFGENKVFCSREFFNAFWKNIKALMMSQNKFSVLTTHLQQVRADNRTRFENINTWI